LPAACTQQQLNQQQTAAKNDVESQFGKLDMSGAKQSPLLRAPSGGTSSNNFTTNDSNALDVFSTLPPPIPVAATETTTAAAATNPKPKSDDVKVDIDPFADFVGDRSSNKKD